MPEPTSTPQQSPDRDRAVHALDRAVEYAERGVSARPVALARPEDVAALEPGVARSRLDRVMMGQHADLGLDALLAGGILDAILPEVKMMVGLCPLIRAASSILSVPNAFTSKSCRGSVTDVVTATCPAR